MWRERVGFGNGDQEHSTAPETGASVMPIGPYLSKQAFGPEVTQAMGIAFDAVCRALAIGNNGVVHPRIVARRIIELAQRGGTRPRAPARSCAGNVQVRLAPSPDRAAGERRRSQVPALKLRGSP